YTGHEGSGKALTPQLDRLAAEGTVFGNAWATAPWTLPAHASMFSGMLSSSHGCHINHWRFDEEHTTLAAVLTDAGYETAAFFSNPWLSDRISGVLRGFAIRNEAPLSDMTNMSLGRSDQGGASINSHIKEWLDGRGDGAPFLLFVNYLEAHLPYDPPSEYRAEHLTDLPPGDIVTVAWSEEFNAGLHPPGSVEWPRIHRLYGGDVYHADRLLAGLISMLQERGLYDNSVIIVTSDHGENLGDHGLMDHQFSVHETLLSVPLAIRAPHALKPGAHDEPVMLIDLFATILDFAGVTDEGIPPLSRSLRPLQYKTASSADPTGWNDRMLIAEYGGGHATLINSLNDLNPGLERQEFERGYRTVRRGDYRLTIGTDDSLWLHNLAADPAQQTNIAKEHPQIVEELYVEMRRLLSREFKQDPEQIDIDEESLKKLRSLGYIK
ncbi:MAG: sulfatase, partial [Candidatus Latescibacterota bacterium]